MRILVTGANGLIGRYVVYRLRADGHNVSGSCRRPGKVRGLPADIDLIQADFNTDVDPQVWHDRLGGFDAVVNCVGALQDGAGDNLENVHIRGASALFSGAQSAGVLRIVHISAIGADAKGNTGFARTKAKTEELLSETEVEWVVLRPGLVLAPTVYGGSAALRGLAGLPWITPLPASSEPVQIIGIDDLTRIVSLAISTPELVGGVHDVANPAPTTLPEIVAQLRGWLGFKPGHALRVPNWLMWPVTKGADLAGVFGWRSPMRSTAWAQLGQGVVARCDHLPDRDLIGEIRPLEAVLASAPSTLQDRWHARFYFLKPLIVLLLGIFGIVTGLIALWPGRGMAESELMAVGTSAGAAAMLNLAASTLDIFNGLLILWKRTHKLGLMLLLAVCGVYLVAGSILDPSLWADPLGPLIKVFPVVALCLVAAAMWEER